MLLRDLRAMVAAEPETSDDTEVKVWLPGSRISLTPAFFGRDQNVLLIEGNLDKGSALEGGTS